MEKINMDYKTPSLTKIDLTFQDAQTLWEAPWPNGLGHWI